MCQAEAAESSLFGGLSTVIQPSAVDSGWSKVVDDSAGVYFYNAHTGECVWDRPPEYVSARASVETDWSHPEGAIVAAEAEWQTYWDDVNQCSYYYNMVRAALRKCPRVVQVLMCFLVWDDLQTTGESTYEIPSELVE